MKSMTGHGSASLREKGLDIEVEVRSLNHRFFNLKTSLSSALARNESEVEKMVRGRIARGSVSVNIAVKQVTENGPVLPETAELRSVVRRLRRIRKDLKIPGDVTMESLLGIPALWTPRDPGETARKLWPKVKKLVGAALDELERMRVREGRGIRRDVLARLKRIEEVAVEIGKLSRRVVAAYEKKLLERVNTLTSQHGLKLGAADLAREVAIYADRSDINEELQRLRSHCREFRRIMGRPGAIGRKMDFLTQELGREANTLAAKGSDSRISALAVEIKSEIEKIKEQSENTE